MTTSRDEDALLESSALQNAAAILSARNRAVQELAAAKEALHASNERLRSVLESITDGLAVVDRNWRFVYLNSRAAEVFQRVRGAPSELTGRSLWEELPDLEGTRLGRAFKRAVAEGTAQQLEHFYPPLQSWFEVRVYPSRDGLSIYFQDVTRRKSAESLVEFEKRVLTLIVRGAPLRDVLIELARAVEAQSVEGMLCSVLLASDDGLRLIEGAAPSLPFEWNAAIDGLPIGPASGSCGTAAHERRPIVASDVSSDVHWEGWKDLALANGLAACASHPVFSSRGDLLGTVAVYYRRARTPSERDTELLTHAARLAGVVIERARAEEAIRRSESRLSATFEQAAVGIAIADAQGRFEEGNPRLLEILGRSLDELRTHTLYELTHPDDQPATLNHVRRLLAGEVSRYEHEKRYVRPDGSIVWVLVSAAVLKGVDGAGDRLVGVLEDITPRKQAEEALRTSEQFSRSIVESSQDCIKTLSLTGDILWISDHGRQALGAQDAGEVVGRSWLDFWEGDDRRAAEAALAAAVAGGNGNFIGRTPAGETGQWWNVAITPMLDAAGRPEELLAVSRNVSERLRNEERLRDEARALELLNRTGTTLTSNLDLESLVQAVTDAATELSGAKFGAFFYNSANAEGDVYLLYTLSGAPREAFQDFGHPRPTAVFGPTFRGEGIIRSPDITRDPRYGKMGPHYGMPAGHLPVRSYLAVPVIARSGEVIGGLFFGHPEANVFTERAERLIAAVAAQAAVAIDNARLYQGARRAATEREALLASERAARAEAERANRIKDEFLATLSHELRTPLSSILGWAHMLRSGRVAGDDVPKGLEIIERNARSQAQLIEDLLDMSRIISGKLRLDVQPVEPTTFIDAALETIRPAAEAKEIRIERILDPAPCHVAGDPGRLQQVIWNLLSNAIKFTPKGGKVQVILQRVDSHIEVGVADSGIGIEPRFIAHVFERFRQADSSSTRTYGGLGLGLSIVKQLVEMHGGSVRAESPGKMQGTTFTVSLPLTPLRHDLAPPQHHPRDHPDIALDFHPVDLNGIRVLVVDDQEDSRDLIGRVLAECGAAVDLCGDAEQALRVLERSMPDVIVSDIGMPGLDGYEFLQRVRARDMSSRIPAIALTAFARSEDRTRALRAGFLAHIAKPVEPSELVAGVATAARHVKR